MKWGTVEKNLGSNCEELIYFIRNEVLASDNENAETERGAMSDALVEL